MHLNVEIKAKCADPGSIREYLKKNNASFKGVDLQTDTYFNVQKGRLKLREGNIENNLIYYERENKEGPKHSDFDLIRTEDAGKLKQALSKAIGVKVVVRKQREIYYIDNVKFHIDTVDGLGSFMEIEAGNILAPKLTAADLARQCDGYMKAFGIAQEDLVDRSYSDLLM